MRHIIILTGLVILLGSCQRDGDVAPTFIQKFGGEPYIGQVTVSIMAPGHDTRHHQGRASFQLTDSTDTIASLVLFGSIDGNGGQAGDAGFVLDGTYTDAGWSFHQDPMQFDIDGHGNIMGQMETPDERYTYTGSLSTTEFSIITVVERLTPTDGGYPVGTTFNFEHRGKRSDPNSPPSEDGDGCRNIRWEFRNVWNPGGGAMSLIRVPVCYD